MSRLPSNSMRRGVRTVASAPAFAGFRPAAAALAVATAFTLQPRALQAQPVGPQVIHGQASSQRNGNNLLVTTQNGAGTSHSAINWQSFSVPGGSVTHFNQPSATSTSINRVLGPDPSAIFGTLSSNGRIVLVNPAGIAVGQGGLVDTAGFTASTLRMSDADAIAGRLIFSGDGAAGPLQVDGQIIARNGDVVLIAPKVQTGSDAVIQSQGGATVLAAGQKVSITGRGLEGIHLEVQAGDEAVNLGTLKGDAVGIFANTLKHSGLIAAQVVSTEGGKVVLQAIGGDALVDGTITATATGGKGGQVDVLGQRVGLLAGASIDASGANGGGQVRIGGDYQGANPDVPNAAFTYVDAAATVKADATVQGDGGRVIVWADEATRMHGQISARGGESGGNGGFAEVSGKQYLEFTGRADLRAPNGTTGTLLLDPNDITIEVTGGTNTTNQGPVFDGGPSSARIKESDLEAQLATSSVLVATNGGTGGTGTITIATGVNLQWTTNNALGLQADKGIDLQGSITAGSGAAVSLQALGGGVVQNAATSVVTVGSLLINAQNGGVSMDGANMVDRLAGVAAGAGNNFSFKNAKDLAIATVATPYGSQRSGIVADDGTNAGAISVRTSAGSISVESGNDVIGGSVLLDGSVDLKVDGAMVKASTGSLTAKAGRDVLIGRQATTSAVASLEAAKSLLVQAQGSVRTSLPVGSGATYQSQVYLTGGGGLANGVTIEAKGGDVDLGLDTHVTAIASPIKVIASGNIAGNGWLETQGSSDSSGATAAISLTASGGSISFSTLDAGRYYTGTGLHGGNVTLNAAGDVSGGTIYADGSSMSAGTAGNGGAVQVNAGGSIFVDYISASGGDSYEVYSATPPQAAGNAGQGGSISLNAGTGVVANTLQAWGGNSYASSLSPGDGSVGGNVSVRSSTGDVTLQYIDVSGGSGSTARDAGNVTIAAAGGNVQLEEVYAVGGYASGSGTGGRGGTVSVSASGDIVMTPYSYYSAINADGGSSDLGTGGQGGAINVKVGGNLVVVPQAGEATLQTTEQTTFGATSGGSALSASGGMGGYNGTDGGTGGTGGAGGSIRVQGTGTALVLDSSIVLVAAGGQGGSAGGAGGIGGAGGAGGTIDLLSSGSVNLRSAGLDASGGTAGSNGDGSTTGASGAIGHFTAAGTSVEVESDLVVNANWTNSSIVNIRGSSVVSGSGVFRNASDLKLYDTAQLNMAAVENAGRMSSFGSAVRAHLTQNTGLLEVVGGSSLYAPIFYNNSGKMQVDGILTIGSPRTASSTTTAPLDTSAATVTGGTFTNAASGILSGTGSIIVDGGSGTVDNFGTIAPGGVGSVGTLTVDANLVMEAGSTYAADVLNATSHDVLKVEGLATTGGSFAVNYLSGATFSAGQVFSMLQASGVTATTLPTVDKTELTATATTTELQLLAMAPFPTPIPAPAPAPAVEPTTTEEQAAEVVTNQVTQFAQLFLQEALQQLEEDKKETQIGKDDIVVTETACK